MTPAEQYYAALQASANAGDRTIYVYLARVLYRGDGVDQNKTLARVYARDGWPSALQAFVFALFCDFGEGGAVDGASAMKYYRYAAERGIPEAAWSLAWLYLKGQLTTQNYIQARMWLLVALLGQYNVPGSPRLANGNYRAIAQFQLGYCEARMTEAEKQEAGVIWSNFAFLPDA